jgi:hypothetical protein
MLRIWRVSLFWAGMAATLEASSPRTMPASWRRLSCGRKSAGHLLLCIAVLLAATNTSSHARLSLGGCSVLAIIVGEKGPVDITEKK